MIDADPVAIAAVGRGPNHDAVGSGVHRGACYGDEIDTVMHEQRPHNARRRRGDGGLLLRRRRRRAGRHIDRPCRGGAAGFGVALRDKTLKPGAVEGGPRIHREAAEAGLSGKDLAAATGGLYRFRRRHHRLFRRGGGSLDVRCRDRLCRIGQRSAVPAGLSSGSARRP